MRYLKFGLIFDLNFCYLDLYQFNKTFAKTDIYSVFSFPVFTTFVIFVRK